MFRDFKGFHSVAESEASTFGQSICHTEKLRPQESAEEFHRRLFRVSEQEGSGVNSWSPFPARLLWRNGYRGGSMAEAQIIKAHLLFFNSSV